MSHAPGAGSLQRNFILQQGFGEPEPKSCPAQYAALHFQPKIVGLVVLSGIVLQAPAIFLALGLVLWWCALAPRWSPFDALYNRLMAGRPGAVALAPAPAPRRFAQGMAGTFCLLVGAALLAGWSKTATALEILLVAAVGALVLGGFCLGSFLFHVLRGQLDFVRRTLPWSR